MNAHTLPIADRRTVRHYIRHLITEHRRPLAKVLLLYGLAVCSGLVGPRLVGALVQDLQDGTTTGHVITTTATLSGFILLQAFLIRIAFRAAGRLAATVQATVRERFVDDVLNLPLDIVERSDDGDLVTRASQDVETLRGALQLAVPQVVEALVWLVLSLVALLLVSPLLSLALLVTLPPLFAVNQWYLARARDGFLREANASSAITEGLSATIDGATTVETFQLQEQRDRRAEADTTEWYEAVRYTLWLRTVLYAVEEFLFTFPIGAALLLGGYAYQQGWVNLGQVTAATLYILQVMIPLETLLDWLDTLQQAGASLARLLGVRKTQASSPPPPSTSNDIKQPHPHAHSELAAHNLHFSYDGDSDVLHGIDITVQRGERIAIVGPTGSGKSTLARLLSGIHPPRVGQIALAGTPIHQIAPSELRGHIALVTQNHYLFRGTLRDNLLLSQPPPQDGAAHGETDDSSLHHALEAVGADTWVGQLPEQLNTSIGSGGHALSEAQAQHIALARLLLKNPRILILDEATAQLDPNSARSLERSLAAVLNGRTVISIAHRLHTAYDADRIAVVEGGRIVELGSHDELLSRSGSYAGLWASWN